MLPFGWTFLLKYNSILRYVFRYIHGKPFWNNEPLFTCRFCKNQIHLDRRLVTSAALKAMQEPSQNPPFPSHTPANFPSNDAILTWLRVLWLNAWWGDTAHANPISNIIFSKKSAYAQLTSTHVCSSALVFVPVNPDSILISRENSIQSFTLLLLREGLTFGCEKKARSHFAR